jgi:hypothetical protein
LLRILENGFSSAVKSATPPIIEIPAFIRVEPCAKTAPEKAALKVEPAIKN